jgi:hypothetical protein
MLAAVITCIRLSTVWIVLSDESACQIQLKEALDDNNVSADFYDTLNEEVEARWKLLPNVPRPMIGKRSNPAISNPFTCPCPTDRSRL